MTLKEAEQINIGDKVIVKDYQGEHEVLAIQDLHPGKVIGYWLDNGDLINHKRVERVVKPQTDMDNLATEMMEHICVDCDECEHRSEDCLCDISDNDEECPLIKKYKWR